MVVLCRQSKIAVHAYISHVRNTKGVCSVAQSVDVKITFKIGNSTFDKVLLSFFVNAKIYELYRLLSLVYYLSLHISSYNIIYCSSYQK